MARLKFPTPKEIESREFEERLFAEVAREIDSGVRRPGLWAKALADADGNQDRARALYIRYRAQSMLDEAYQAAHAPDPASAPDPLADRIREIREAQSGLGPWDDRWVELADELEKLEAVAESEAPNTLELCTGCGKPTASTQRLCPFCGPAEPAA